ncbi:MAG: PP2C family protein-serine/threonine phosphatase [bacterium]|nr:PP2C family protein-serine/threonine phosphatase [bacterium]
MSTKPDPLHGLPPVPAAAGDFSRVESGVQITSRQGRRPYQEDRHLVQSGLDIPDARKFLAEAFHAAAVDTNKYRSGATGTGVVISKDGKLNAAFLGDSPVIIFTHDKTTGDVTARKITRDHHAAIASEKEKVEDAGGRVHENGRVDGRLMLSRAFGDAGITGVLREPEFVSVDLKKDLDAGRDVYVMVSSDGLLEGTRHRDYIAPLKQAIADGATDALADIFTALAYHNGSEDNLTAAIYKIPAKQNGDLFIALADGHGGKAAAEKVVETFEAKARLHLKP